MARASASRKIPPPRVDPNGPDCAPARRDGDRRARILAAAREMALRGATEGERASARARIAELTGTPAPETVSAPPPPAGRVVDFRAPVASAPPQTPPPAPAPVPQPPPVASAPKAPSAPSSAPAWRVLATMRGVEIRERDGVIYCTCPDWIESAMAGAKIGPNGRRVGNPAAGTCRHLDAYRASIAPQTPPPAPAPVPQPPPVASAPKAPSAPSSAPAAPRATTGSSASAKAPPPPPPDTRPIATLRRDADTGAQWLQFSEKPDKEIRAKLKDPAYRWKWHDAREQWFNGPKAKIPACVRIVDGGACYYAREKRGAAPQTPPPASTVTTETVSAPPPVTETLRPVGHNPDAPKGPVKIASVKITFTEARDVSGVRLATYPSLAACSDALRTLADGAPAPGRGYAKTDVVIAWSDGESATVKIDLNARHVDYAGNLAADEARVLWTWAAKSGDARAARLLTSYQLD